MTWVLSGVTNRMHGCLCDLSDSFRTFSLYLRIREGKGGGWGRGILGELGDLVD